MINFKCETGLVDKKNNSALISVIQLICNNLDLVNLVLDISKFGQLKDVINGMYSDSTPFFPKTLLNYLDCENCYSPSKIYKKIIKLISIENVDKVNLKSQSIFYQKSIENISELKENSLMTKTFYGQFLKKRKCGDCLSQHNFYFECFNILNLFNKGKDVQECINKQFCDTFGSSEECNYCGGFTESIVNCMIYKLPERFLVETFSKSNLNYDTIDLSEFYYNCDGNTAKYEAKTLICRNLETSIFYTICLDTNISFYNEKVSKEAVKVDEIVLIDYLLITPRST